MRTHVFLLIVIVLSSFCFSASMADELDLYSNRIQPDVINESLSDPDVSLQMDKKWKLWSENIDTHLKQKMEAKLLAQSNPVGRTPRSARVSFAVTNLAKLQDAMIVVSSLNEKFDALAVESVKSMEGQFILLFPEGSKRTSIIKTAWITPANSLSEECKGESWNEFMDGNCEFYIFKKKDEKNIEKLNQQIAEFNKACKDRPPFKDFLVVRNITDVQPAPDPDEGYGQAWKKWADELDGKIFDVVLATAVHDGIQKVDISQKCKVCFSVTNQAEVKNVRLVQSSRNKAFDQIVMDVIRTKNGNQTLLFPKFSQRTSITKTIEVDLDLTKSYRLREGEQYYLRRRSR